MLIANTDYYTEPCSTLPYLNVVSVHVTGGVARKKIARYMKSTEKQPHFGQHAF